MDTTRCEARSTSRPHATTSTFPLRQNSIVSVASLLFRVKRFLAGFTSQGSEIHIDYAKFMFIPNHADFQQKIKVLMDHND